MAMHLLKTYNKNKYNKTTYKNNKYREQTII